MPPLFFGWPSFKLSIYVWWLCKKSWAPNWIGLRKCSRKYLLFQCFAPRCLEIYPSLDNEQRQTLYCPHLQAAQDALSAGRFAVGKSLKLSFLKEILKDENDYKILEAYSSNGKINISVLPEEIYVVPSFSAPTHDSPVDYIHIRKQNCPLTSCKESKSKLHMLSKKETPLCLHTVLIHSLEDKSQSLPSASSSASLPSAETGVKKTIKNPKINRDLTTKVVMDKISEHFPTMTEMESSGFITRSRTDVENWFQVNVYRKQYWSVQGRCALPAMNQFWRIGHFDPNRPFC